jgi:hypothetical protein
MHSFSVAGGWDDRARSRLVIWSCLLLTLSIPPHKSSHHNIKIKTTITLTQTSASPFIRPRETNSSQFHLLFHLTLDAGTAASRGFVLSAITFINSFPKPTPPILHASPNVRFAPVPGVKSSSHFLDSGYASRAFPVAVQDFKCDALSNLIWKNEDAIALIYDRKRGTIQKSNVDALMMQLIVLRIIDFQDIDKNGCGSLVLTREKTPFTPFN